VCRIFVVDDDESIRETVRVFLSLLGHEVHEAKDGREALEWLAQNASRPPCVAVIDLRMPVLDGWDLLERMRLNHRWKDLPIVVLSATIIRSAAPPVLSASDYWSKPLDFERVERIHQHCPAHAASWEA
jgi:two-component system response regulator AtoC